MTGQGRCSWCGERAVACTTRAVGERPKNPGHEHTKMDERRVVVVRACAEHIARLGEVKR